MEQEVKQANQMPQEEEIDLVEVVRKLWKNRKLILKITVVFMVLGVLVALFSPKEYTAGCTMVPQSGDKKVGGNLSGLASMVGINLGVLREVRFYLRQFILKLWQVFLSRKI